MQEQGSYKPTCGARAFGEDRPFALPALSGTGLDEAGTGADFCGGGEAGAGTAPFAGASLTFTSNLLASALTSVGLNSANSLQYPVLGNSGRKGEMAQYLSKRAVDMQGRHQGEC